MSIERIYRPIDLPVEYPTCSVNKRRAKTDKTSISKTSSKQVEATQANVGQISASLANTALANTSDQVQAEAKTSKQGLAQRLNWLRAGVLGANDGILSISGLVIGVAVANPANNLLIALAGISGIVSAAVSMGAGEYVSVSTQRDSEKEIVERERARLSQNFAAEQERLAELWVEKGLSPQTAREVASDLMAADPVDAVVSTEYGIDHQDLVNPWMAAASSFVSFVVGAIIPLAVMLLCPPSVRVMATIAAVAVALALTGIVSAKLGEASKGKAMLRLVIGGLLAMGFSYLVGEAFGV